MFARVLACAILLSTSGTAAAADPKQPTGKWTVETLANECLLVRPYGTATNPLFLTMSQAPMGGGTYFTILYKREWTLFGGGTARLSFDGEAPIDATYTSMLLWNPSKELRVRTLRSVQIDTEEESKRFVENASSISFNVPKELNATFTLPDQTGALRALNDCALKLGVKWGFPLEEQRRIVKPARAPGGLGRLFRADDYPVTAHKRGAMGRARIRIIVGSNGEPTECSILASTGSADLDAATCSVIQSRAKFEPAADVEGKPVRSVQVATVRWVLIG